MESLLIGYALFCLTTSLAAFFTLMWPVLIKLKGEQPNNQLIQYPFITASVFILMGILSAPLLFFPAIIPTLAETFQKTLYASIKD